MNLAKDNKFAKVSPTNFFHSYVAIVINILMNTSLPFHNASLRYLSSHLSVYLLIF